MFAWQTKVSKKVCSPARSAGELAPLLASDALSDSVGHPAAKTTSQERGQYERCKSTRLRDRTYSRRCTSQGCCWPWRRYRYQT